MRWGAGKSVLFACACARADWAGHAASTRDRRIIATATAGPSFAPVNPLLTNIISRDAATAAARAAIKHRWLGGVIDRALCGRSRGRLGMALECVA